jgi:hypothetical protein
MRCPFWIGTGLTIAACAGTAGCSGFSLDELLGSDCEVEVDDECVDDLFSDDDDESFLDGLDNLLDDED